MLFADRCAGCDRPGEVLCRPCRFALVSPPPSRLPPGVEAALAFEGRVRDVMLGLKYRNRRRVAQHLAGVVVRRLGAERPDVVTWVPASRARRRRRGFDPGELIARHVARQLGVPGRALLARGRGPAQTGRTRHERLAGPLLRARPGLGGRRVLVVDDVVTTGATLRAARRELLAAGATAVRTFAVAATPDRSSRRVHRPASVPAFDRATARQRGVPPRTPAVMLR